MGDLNLTLNMLEWQALATDLLAKCMTALVALCLTLTSPYVFKIAASFLVWLIRGVERLAIEWKNADHARQASESPVSTPSERAHLNASKRSTYGTATSQKFDKTDGGLSNHTRPDVSENPMPDPTGSDPLQASQEPSIHSPHTGPMRSGKQCTSPRSLKTTVGGSNQPSSSSRNVVPNDLADLQDEAAEPSKAVRQSRSLSALRDPSSVERQAPSNDEAVHILQSAGDSRETVWKYVKYIIRGSKKQVNAPSTTMIVITTVFFFILVGHALA